jgi:[NiFe] hydrogenase assembly HybE family chaperone
MNSKNMQEIKQTLETVYRHIEQKRMRDVPVCNPSLRVEAVGFREWRDFYLGVMITPWFMNLMLLPVRHDEDGDLQEGSKQVHVFPSGHYEFINGKEEGVGSFQVCSLFSPMQEFKDQQSAVDTANIVLDELMETSHQDTVSMTTKTVSAELQNKNQNPSAHRQKPISRRDFLRGGRQRE